MEALSQKVTRLNSNTTLQKIPPHNIEAERFVIAAILLDNDALPKAVEILKEEDFYLESHRRIFHVILELFEENEVIDVITISDELNKQGILEDTGGSEYLLALVESIPTSANVTSHSKIVKEKALLRRMINAATRIAGEGYEETEDVDALLDRAEQIMFDVSEDRIRNSFFSLKDLVQDSFKTVEEIYERGAPLAGVPTGFRDFDEMTCGLHPSDLIIIAARPSMGKTSLALNIGLNIALREKKPVAIFSLETSKEQLVLRMLCSEARIDAHKLRAGFLGKEDWPRLTKAAGRLVEAPVFIDDTPGISVMEMRAKARRLMKEHGLSLIIVDYLQLMQGRGKSENRQQEISAISRSLKGLARELDVPLIALSQLSRAVESRNPPKPVLSDLRESGAIEQDADLIAFIYRPEMYKKGDEDGEVEEGIAEISIGKQRNGPIGKIKLAFIKGSTRFENLSEEGAPF